MRDPTLDRYLNGDYAEKNPDWDSGDACWKASKVLQILRDNGCEPASVVEIGCGSGAVLAQLQENLPGAAMAGFDIAPNVQPFWEKHSGTGIRFVLGNYMDQNEPIPDVILVLDVLEHLGNPWEFLAHLRGRCVQAVFHIPLDLSAVNVLRESSLLHVRDKVGHLHYFTKTLALAMLEECGFEVIEARYTGAALSAPNRRFRTRAVGLVRGLVSAALGDVGVRLLGGETLMVLARPKSEP